MTRENDAEAERSSRAAYDRRARAFGRCGLAALSLALLLDPVSANAQTAAASSLTAPAASSAAPSASDATGVNALVAEVIRTNPDIDAQRNQVRGLQARLSAARAAGLPEINGNGQVQRRKIDVKNGGQGDAEFTLGFASVEGRLPLFDGARTTNGIRVAQQELASGQASFHGKVSDVLLNLLTAIADVHRDEAIRGYAEERSDAVAAQLRAISRRLEIGEATQTDQALGRARLATAQTGIISTNEALTVSRSAFARVAGHTVSAVPELPDLAPIPPNLAAAQARAAEENARVRASRRTAIAAKYGYAAAKGALLPEIDAVAGYEYSAGGVANLFTGKLPDDRSAAYGGVEMNVPLFKPRNYAEIRRLAGLQAQRLAEYSAAQRSAIDLVTSAWAGWQSASQTIEAQRIAVAAIQQAADGTRREWAIGNRTLTEVLDAQNELLNARVALERAIHDEYTARVTILAAVGDLKPPAILRTTYETPDASRKPI
jgi:outer membrane protein